MSTVYNPGKTPVVLDEGRVLGGQERSDVPDSDRVQTLIERGLLVEVEKADEQETAVSTEEG